MSLTVAELLLDGGFFYGAIGFLFAVAFVSVGVGRVDSLAHGTGIGFRLLILPGCAALWPLLMVRWLAATRRTT